METEKKEKEKEKEKKPYNIVVPFNVPGKPDIGLLDLNKIFQVNLNYNFDSLKTLLEGLVASYKKTEEELENLRVCNKTKDKKINDLEQRLIDLNILLSTSIGDTDAVARLKDMKSKLKEDMGAEYSIKYQKVSEIKTDLKESENGKEKEKEKDKEYVKIERPVRTKRVNPIRKRKKIHAPINKDIKLDIQIGNDDLINNIIVSFNNNKFNFIKFINYRKKLMDGTYV